MLRPSCWLPLLLSLTTISWAGEAAAPSDELWKLAVAAYEDGNTEVGHKHLRSLIAKHPGDVDLAVKCLERIRETAGRHDADNPWLQYAVHRLCALERIGAISANSSAVRESMNTRTAVLTAKGRRFEAVDEADRMAEANPHDIFWRILRAQVMRKLDSVKTRPIYERLRNEMDLDHPDAETRYRWSLIAKELQSDFDQLPKPIAPLPTGSPLSLMELDDPEGRWQTVADRSPREIPEGVDRIAGAAMLDTEIILWRDMSGLTDPARALDLHLLSKPQAEMASVRKLQAASFAQEDIPVSADEARILELFRRYRWASPAQQLLLVHANRMLLAGRAQAALRSFQDIFDHAADARLKDESQVGCWAALVQMGDSEKITSSIAEGAPQKTYIWMGKPATVAEIREQLLARRAAPVAVQAPTLSSLKLHVVRLPPVSPWPAETPAGGACVDMRVVGQQLMVSGRNLIAMYDASEPDQSLWTRLQRHPAEARSPGSYYAGYFRPTVAGPVIYARWGFTSVPTGIAAFQRATGRPLWSNEPAPYSTPHQRRVFHVPLGDPVVSDGMLYYLQWSTIDNVNHNRGRRLNLVCFDPLRRQEAWKNTIAESGLTTDLLASFERASPQTALYGNRVTVHHGAVYSNSNAGLVARSDIRDGRTDWIHYYRRGGANHLNLGSSPIVIDDKVICLPRDAGGRVFALDQRTGRLVWDNTQIIGVEMVGVFRDTLIVRGQTTLAALDTATGEARWYLPISKSVLQRVQLIGDSIFLAHRDALERLDASTGQVKEVRLWTLHDERPHGFVVHDGHLYVVTDKPAEDGRDKLGKPLNPEAPKSVPLALPLVKAWSLPRSNAIVSIPSTASALAGRGYLLSGGLLECIDISPQGSIRWRRFVNTSHAQVHVVDKKVLIVERGTGRVPGASNRLVAFDGEDGRPLWDTPIADNLNQLILCDSMLVFYNHRGQMLAVDAATGERAWERDLQGNLMALSWVGGQLHGMYVPQWQYARHLTLQPDTGRTVREGTVDTQSQTGPASNGKLVKDGYYEVTFDAMEARYVRLAALSEINGQGWTSIAELQVIGQDGDNVPRDKWKVVKVDSAETQHRFDTSGAAAFDGDPATWWHTKWIGGIPRHPHEIQIDMGSRQMIKGIRYLPAVIINHNGMIRDYELFAGNDPNNWGAHAAKGVMVNRVRIERPQLAQRSVFFESHNRPKNAWEVFRYDLDGTPAKMIGDNARLVTVQDPYVVLSVRRDNKEILSVLRVDDASYRFELTSEHPLHRDGEIQIDADRLILGRRSLVVVDLVKRRYVVAPTKDNQKYNRPGMIVREGPDNLLKVVNFGGQGQAMFLVDLKTGEMTESILADRTQPFSDFSKGRRQMLTFNRIVLFADNASVSAWINQEAESVP
ncbi:MAG: PQQ-binding-like beta-propeller repeat protein [Pirellulales bacterium]